MVCADATYKLIDLKIPLYVLLVEDGNLQSEIAALGLLVNKEETLSWFFKKFKEHNPASVHTRVFITDKDMKDRTVIKSLFPESQMVICLFHILRTFNREITCDKLVITTNQRDMCKQVFEELCYCKNEMKYTKIYTDFINSELTPHQVKAYFNKNLHNITMGNWSNVSDCKAISTNNK